MAHSHSLRGLLRAAAALLALVALSPAAPAQDGTPDGGAPPADGTPASDETDAASTNGAPTGFRPSTRREMELAARFGDHHIAVVGEELITRDEVIGFINSQQYDDPVDQLEPGLTQMQVEERRFYAGLEQMIELELKIQGGKDQGYEPEIFRQIRDNAFQNQVRIRGGSSQMSEWLAGYNMTPEEFRGYIERQLLARFWEDSVTGRSPGATGRLFVDPYVRPGQLFARYRTYARDPDPRFGEIVGRLPARTVLRRLVLDSREYQGPAATLSLAQSIRQNVLDGVVEFDAAINEYARTDMRGAESTLDGATEAIVRQLGVWHAGEDLESWVRTGSVGDLSPVSRFDVPNGPPAFIVYRLEKRVAAQAATPFVDLELQNRLRESMEDDESTIRVARGLGELVRSTYVAPFEIRDALLQRGRRGSNRR